MRKAIVCLVAAVMTLCATTGAKAQKVGFGVKGGLNLSTWTQDDSKFRVGVHLGGFANIKFNKMFAIQPELMYSMEGAKWKTETSTTVLGTEYYAKSKYSVTTHKLIVPIMFQFTPIRELTLEAGPQLGFNLSMKGHLDFETNIAGQSNYDDDIDYDSDDYNTFELGLALGARFNIAKNMSVGARYVYGLTPLFDEVKVNGKVLSDAVHTHNVMFSFSYMF